MLNNSTEVGECGEWDDTAHKADERETDGREGEQQLVVVALEEAKVGLAQHYMRSVGSEKIN